MTRTSLFFACCSQNTRGAGCVLTENVFGVVPHYILPSSRVIPAVLSEERLVLGAVLRDGTRIRGQYNISHPRPKNIRLTPQSATPRFDRGQERPGGGSGSGGVGRHRRVVKSSLDSEEAILSLHPAPISMMTYLLHDPTWRRRDALREEEEEGHRSATTSPFATTVARPQQ